MFTPITYPTAKTIWLCNDIPYYECVLSQENLLRKNVPPEQISAFISAKQLPAPAHLLVPDAASRYLIKDEFEPHVMPKKLPNGSFVHLDNTVYSISPELCYLLAARELSIPELAVLATDLCAIYRIDTEKELGLAGRVPITSVSKIRKYLDKVKSVHGIARARTALPYALDCSNSPMESKMSVLGVLSYYQGGFALPKPELNFFIKLSSDGRRFLGRDKCCCDMVWPERKVVVEYDSDLVHLTPDQVHYDKRKETALQLSNYTVIHVTKDHFKNFETVENLYRMIGKALGVRQNKAQLDKYRDKRMICVPRILRIRYN